MIALSSPAPAGAAQTGSARRLTVEDDSPGDIALMVPAATQAGDSIGFPGDLAPGERLALWIGGGVEDESGGGGTAGARESAGGQESTGGRASAGSNEALTPAGAPGGIAAGSLVASFAGGPPFLLAAPGPAPDGGRRLLWSAPAAGRLELWVKQDDAELDGSYKVTAMPLGPRGDPRQGLFPPPTIRILPREPGGPLLAVRYRDRSGFGLDLETLKVFLDTDLGQRFVLSPYLGVQTNGAVLQELPSEVRPPPGVHRVTAEIGDELGNVSVPDAVFLDRP